MREQGFPHGISQTAASEDERRGVVTQAILRPRTSRRWPTRALPPPRRREGRAGLCAGTGSRYRRRGLQAHRHPVHSGLMTPTNIIVVDPERGPRARAKSGARTRPCRVREEHRGPGAPEMTSGGAEVVFDYVGRRGAETRPGDDPPAASRTTS